MLLSVIVIAKNEESNIRRCLSSVKWADEIIVLDSGSQDNTVAIAKEYTDKVYSTDWQGYGVQKQRALTHAQSRWVLNIDADEWVDFQLKCALLRCMKSNVADAYRVPIRLSFYGKVLRYSSSPKRHVRLFKREGARYSDDVVHEKIILPPKARVKQLREPILHQCYQDISHLLYKINQYSSSSANIKLNQHQPQALLKTMFGTVWMFLRCYFLQRGFLDGREGLLFAFFNAHGTFYRGVKQAYPDKK